MSFQRLLKWTLPAFAVALVLAARCSAAPLTYDVSHFDHHNTIDCNSAEWGDHGLRIDQLTNFDGPMPSPEQFNAHVRLGWDETGLDVLVEVVDPKITESTDDTALNQGDAVELFLAPSWGSSSSVQLVVAPPSYSKSASFRTQFIDNRTGDLAKTPMQGPITNSVLTPSGYTVEARLRWSDIGFDPAMGKQAAFQVYVDNESDGHISSLAWFPQYGADYDSSLMNTIRLSDKPGAPVEADATAGYVRFRRVKADVTAAASLSGRTVTISDGKRVIGRGTLVADNGRATASISMPLAPRGQQYGSITFRIGNGAFARLDLPNFAKACADQFDRERLLASRFVFSADDFPTVDFEHPSLVSDLIGPYTIQTRYYDNDYNPVSRPTKPGRYAAVAYVSASCGRHYRRCLTLFRLPNPIAWRDMPQEFPKQIATLAGIDPGVIDINAHGISGQLDSELERSIGQSQPMAQMLGVLYENHDKAHVRIASESDRWMYGLQKSLHDEQQYAYLLTLPNLYDAEPSQRWPLVLFLHGAGERGSNLNVIKVHGPPLLVSEGRKFPFILVSPQCPSNSSWNTAELSDLLDEIEAKYRVDTDRVYVTGLSMGGFGTYNLAMDEPTRFAAIAPMSSGADPDFANLLKGVPIWVFHGDKDPVVPIGGDRDMVTALKAQGADVTFTVIPNGKHDIWDPIYAGNEIYSWLLAHSLKR